MSLQHELDELAKRIASFHAPATISDDEWAKFADNTVIALMAGGESSRYAAVLKGETVQKNAHELPNGDTMIEMAIRQYRDAGMTNFVAMVYHNAHSIEDRLGDGSKLGVHIAYCHDPEPPAGKGGAIRNALESGALPMEKYLIVVNPDDVVLGFSNFVRFMGEAHLEGQSKGMVATAVMTSGRDYSWTGFVVEDNKVIDTQMYPYIPVPAHVGITVFSPSILPRFKELFSLSEKSDFESKLLPILAHEGTLWSAFLTQGEWIAVNDLKSYNQLVKYLAEQAA